MDDEHALNLRWPSAPHAVLHDRITGITAEILVSS